MDFMNKMISVPKVADVTFTRTFRFGDKILSYENNTISLTGNMCNVQYEINMTLGTLYIKYEVILFDKNKPLGILRRQKTHWSIHVIGMNIYSSRQVWYVAMA